MTGKPQVDPLFPLEPLVDTHTHLYLEEFEADYSAVFERARRVGVRYFLLPNLDLNSLPVMQRLCKTYPQECYPMIGLHPSSVREDYKETLHTLRDELEDNTCSYRAIGEIGLDYYWSTEFKHQMYDALQIQLHWALEYDLPVSLHARDAVKDVVQCIKSVDSGALRGVFHSFTGDEEDLLEVLELPLFCVGVNGLVTFKNSRLPDLLYKHVPIHRIVVETDAPYLTPVPYRGKRNEPGYLPYVIQRLAEIYTLSYEETARAIFANSIKMFNLATPVVGM